jgi:transcription elongation factor Elf1
MTSREDVVADLLSSPFGRKKLAASMVVGLLSCGACGLKFRDRAGADVHRADVADDPSHVVFEIMES